MRDPIRETKSMSPTRTPNTKTPMHRRTVLPLPADAVDAAFADGVDMTASTSASDDTLSYDEVVSRVNEQLRLLEEQRTQLKSLLREANNSLRQSD